MNGSILIKEVLKGGEPSSLWLVEDVISLDQPLLALKMEKRAVWYCSVVGHQLNEPRGQGSIPSWDMPQVAGSVPSWGHVRGSQLIIPSHH